MNRKQINRKERNDAIINYLDANVQKWSGIPKIGEVKNEFEQNNMLIEQAAEAQNQSKVFVGKNKNVLKKTISEKADIINDIGEAFAVITDNTELESKMAGSATDFLVLKNEDFGVKIKETLRAIEPHKQVLIAEYGLTEEQIVDVQNDFNNFLALNGQPRAYKIASRQATSDLEALFTESNDILTQKLDKVMKLFKRRDTNFYNGYLAARTVVDD